MENTNNALVTVDKQLNAVRLSHYKTINFVDVGGYIVKTDDNGISQRPISTSCFEHFVVTCYQAEVLRYLISNCDFKVVMRYIFNNY